VVVVVVSGDRMTEPAVALTVDDWPGLEQWLLDHPLPSDMEDTDLNMTEAAQVFGVSSNAVKSWLTQSDARMPCVARGGNGREYVLRLSWCYAWREHLEAAKKQRAQQLSQLQGQLFGGEHEQEEVMLSPKQVKEVAAAKIEHARAGVMMGKLTELENAYQLFERVFIRFRNSAMGMSDRLERELGLTPPQARQVDRAMEEMLSSLIEEVQDTIIGKDFEPNLEMTPQLVNET
jgi:phage terminase Nu1 subunit (DNA packaging protein)